MIDTQSQDARDEEHEVRAALDLLRAIPGVASDPRALGALDELTNRLDPELIGKSQRLASAARLVNSSLNLDLVLHQALDVAVEVMKAERGAIVLSEGHQVAALHNCERSLLEGDLSSPSRTIVDRTLATGLATFAIDAQADPLWSTQPSIAGSRLRSIACVPLRVRDDVMGVVYLDSRLVPGLFRTGYREILVTFADQAALAIGHALMFESQRERVTQISDLQALQNRILEAIANGVITFSAEREITTFNRAAEATFGLSAENIVGRNAFELGDRIPEFPEFLDTFYASGAVQLRAETEASRTDGTELLIELRLSPLAVAEGIGVAMVVTDVTKQRELETAHEAEIARGLLVKETFSRYLAPHLVESLMKNPAAVALGGERTRATMFFADVRGFTGLAAQLPADRVVEILNTYFEEAVRIVFEEDGLLDKFYGDGLMAVFGPPLVRAGDAARAVSAAIRLQDAVVELEAKLQYPLRISVGLATGDVVAGHFGSARRMDYTVIGDAVNLASGLQSAAPSGTIYCDEATFAAAGPISRPHHRVKARVKGRTELVPAYAIVPLP